MQKPARLNLSSLFVFVLCAPLALAQPSITLETILEHDADHWLWFHPRAAAVPGAGEDGAPLVVLTLQKHLQTSDYYGGLHYMLTGDMGKTWKGPILPPELDWTQQENGETISVCDVTPIYHAPTGSVIALGIQVRYRDGIQLMDKARSHAAAYAVYDPKSDHWTGWKTIDVPDADGAFYQVGPGCGQWLIEPDGSALIPVYFCAKDEPAYNVTVLRCRFDGETLSFVEHGDILELEVERGLVEPSLVKDGETYYLTLRNDQKGYVTRGKDGLHYEPYRAWTFDDGQDLGSYNTQQHWLAHSDGLFLVYTRRGANNDHIVRHRAPLFMARVDTEKLQIVRGSEKVVVPERGAEMGNFGACAINANESWITVSEGMFMKDSKARGAEGATFVAHILWSKPNTATP